MTSSNASSTSVTYQPINLDVNSLHDFFRVSCNTPNQTTAFLQAVTPQTTDCNPGGEYVAVEIPDDTSCEVVFLRCQNSFFEPSLVFHLQRISIIAHFFSVAVLNIRYVGVYTLGVVNLTIQIIEKDRQHGQEIFKETVNKWKQFFRYLAMYYNESCCSFQPLARKPSRNFKSASRKESFHRKEFQTPQKFVWPSRKTLLLTSWEYDEL